MAAMGVTRFRPMLVGLLAIVVSLSFAVPAYAAAPANDDFDNATVITSSPFTDTLSTVEATTAPDDPSPSCGGNGATVWYTYTPSANSTIEIDTFGSDYDTTLAGYVGTRGQLVQVLCNDDAQGLQQSQLSWSAGAGGTYYFMVASKGLTGGNLTFHLNATRFTLGLTVDRATVDRSGTVTLAGTVTCSDTVSADVTGSLTQQNAQSQASGSFGTFVTACTPDGTPWTATATSDTRTRFKRGQALFDAFAIACSLSQCGEDRESGTIQVVRSR